MPLIYRFLANPRSPFILELLLGFGLFAGGVALGNLLRLAACPLCILQRMLYLSLGFSALLGLVAYRPRFMRIIATLLMLLSAGCGTFVAGYQTYIQRFARDIQCGAEVAWWELFVDWAGEHAPLFFQANGLCSDPAWRFLSLSIAEWSLIIFTLLTVLNVHALVRHCTKAD